MPTGSSPPQLVSVTGTLAAAHRCGTWSTRSSVYSSEHQFWPSVGTGIGSPASIRLKYSIGTPP